MYCTVLYQNAYFVTTFQKILQQSTGKNRGRTFTNDSTMTDCYWPSNKFSSEEHAGVKAVEAQCDTY